MSIVRRKAQHRGGETLPQGVAKPLFNVLGGKVRILQIIGEVTTAIEAQANNTKLVANPTTGTDVDLCAVLDITGDVVGTMYHITGQLSDALIATTEAAAETLGDYQPVIVTPGTIDLSCASSNTGATKWTVIYEAVDRGARITRYNG